MPTFAWCQQSDDGGSGATAYELGVGYAWEDAWVDTGLTAERPKDNGGDDSDEVYAKWPEKIGSYQMGTKISRDGKVYECTGHEGWCNQEVYDPIGVHGSATWTLVE